MIIYTRFAPSPTGHLHLGNLRTALFNALFAYHQEGRLLLRIEDTDVARSKKDYVKSIEGDLDWLGLKRSLYDKEKTVFQSKRYSIYKTFYQKLEAMNRAYPCFCTEERLENLHKQQKLAHQPKGYDGHCRYLPHEVVSKRKTQGEPYSLRFRVPETKEIIFKDLVKGEKSFNSNYLHDFVIQKSDKSPSFLYCNALDDSLMDITHVLRGEDHLTNTPKQLLILTALGLNAPFYGHLPLISQSSTTIPLSKREDSFSLRSLREQGYSKEAILNYLARLGHTIASSELMTLTELSYVFSINNLHVSSAHFDESQLNFWQKKAIRQTSKATFWSLLQSSFQEKVPIESREFFIEVIQKMVLLPQEAEDWIDVLFIEPLEYSLEARSAIQQADTIFWDTLLSLFKRKIEKNSPILLEEIKDCLSQIDQKRHKIHWKALRAALTNRLSGPDILSVIKLLGVTRALERVQRASNLSLFKL